MTDEQTGQLLLPFDTDIDSEQKQIVECCFPHFVAPRNDNESLLEFQYQYRVNGKQSALDNIYVLGKEICAKYINTEAKGKRKIKNLSAEEKEEKAHNAVCYVIGQLLRSSDWYISTSFTGYLYLRVKHELYYHRKVDKIVDFVNLDDFFKGY